MNEHISVLKTEALDALQVNATQWYIDATFGRGGHTRAILERGGRVIGFDCDQDAVAFGEANFAQEIQDGRLILINQNFGKLKDSWERLRTEKDIPAIAGILFDFGVSSPQIDTAERGFSFIHNGPLDMRMDKRLGVQAKDLLIVLPEKQLAELFWVYGGEEQSRRIAKMIVQQRTRKPFTTTQELAEAISKVKPRTGHLHPATKVFQALRMAVNSEVDSIEAALPQALEVVQAGGKIVTISFHEGEDRVVKHLFQKWQDKGYGQPLDKKAVMPTEAEVTHNPRSRSAKLRVFAKKES